jgi:hypothetical protein
MSSEAAQQLSVAATRRMERRLRHGGGTLCCRLQLLRAKFWQGIDISGDIEGLQPIAARSAHGRALFELLYGQLLLSRRLAGGLLHLNRGFDLSRNLLTASDYFTVMNRHRLLHQLPLSDSPSQAETLETMLISARVIERMKRGDIRRGGYSHDPKDTYG